MKSGNYEEEIDKMADIIKNNPEALRMLLRSYDEMVKKVYLSDIRDRMEEYPYWCFGFVVNDELLKGEEG